jgi:nitric oxide reductase activation protein
VPRRHQAGPAAVDASAPHVTLHDEWDHGRQAYRRHWTAVHERRLRGTDLQFMAGLQARSPALLRQVRRRIAGLQPDSPQRARRLPDGDAIDLDAALDALVARRAGRTDDDPRLYQARPLRARQLSVALLLDTSSSTGYPMPARSTAGAPARVKVVVA